MEVTQLMILIHLTNHLGKSIKIVIFLFSKINSIKIKDEKEMNPENYQKILMRLYALSVVEIFLSMNQNLGNIFKDLKILTI